MRKQKYNPACVEDEVSISDMLSEELDIVSGDEMNLENEGQSASEELSNTSSESERENETTWLRIFFKCDNRKGLKIITLLSKLFFNN
jgi:hypothetical protein